jgi:hypothetical protein
LTANETPSGLDAVLRVVDMAVHYKADRRVISKFVDRAARQRWHLAEQAAIAASQGGRGEFSYLAMRYTCNAAAMTEETRKLFVIAEHLGGKLKIAPDMVRSLLTENE